MECIYIGYAENRKAYHLYHKHSRRVFESRDIMFNEGIGSTSQITIEVRPPSINSTDPLEEIVEEGASSETPAD
jgi:hypothetical protein